MANAPTTEQIIQRRDQSVKACEAAHEAEQRRVEGSSTLTLSVPDYVLGVFQRGPGGLKAKLLAPSETKEAVCIATARLQADVDFRRRELQMEAEKQALAVKLELRSIELRTKMNSNARVQKMTNKALAEAGRLVVDCLVRQKLEAPPELKPLHPTAPRLAIARNTVTPQK